MKTGKRIGPYVVLKPLGKGNMGAVFLVVHPELGTRYALKLLSADMLGDEDAIRRFELETESLAQVDGHPGIVRVHSAGRAGLGQPYLVMEYVEGRSFHQAQQEGLTREEGLRVVEQIADAVGHVHQHGILHRDIKPENVLLDGEGRARLADFGLSKLVNTAERLTRTGDVIGTPLYMAPELVAPQLGKQSRRSDVYSLGAILYEVLVGEPPFPGVTAVEVFEQLLTAVPASPRKRDPSIPAQVEAVCLKALARYPRDRHADGAAFAEDLRAARADPSPPVEPQSRSVLILAGVAALALLVLALVIVTWGPEDDASPGIELDAARAELARLKGALKKGELEQVITDGEALHEQLTGEQASSLRKEVEQVVAQARAARVQRTWDRDGLLAARELLDREPASASPEAARVLALTGAWKRALIAGRGLPPHQAVRVAAWAGDREAFDRALRALASRQPARARALAWELVPLVGGEPPKSEPRIGGQSWEALAEGEECLREGFVPLAAIAFERAQESQVPEVVVAARLGLARVWIARGAFEQAVDQVRLASEVATDPFDRARCHGWAVSLALALTPRGAERLPESHAGTIRRARAEAPGAPGVLAALARAGREGGQEPQDVVARLRRGTEPSVVRAEEALCTAGRDDGPGLLLARAVQLATMAELGNSHTGARRARALLEVASRLRPRSPSLWVARSRVARVLHEVEEARRAVQRALGLSPGDPEVLVEAARVEEAVAQELGGGCVMRAEAARLRGVATKTQRKLDQQVAAAYSRVESAWGLALDAGHGGPTLVLARQGVARAVMMRLRYTALAGGTRLDQAELAKQLDPLLTKVPVTRLASLRDDLTRALTKHDPAGIELAEESLARVARTVPPGALHTLFLRAATSPRGSSFAKAYLVLAGDLPARALSALRRADVEQDSNVQGLVVDRARRLAPTLTGPRLTWFLLRGDASLETLHDLVEALERAPSETLMILGALGAPGVDHRERFRTTLLADLERWSADKTPRQRIRAWVGRALVNRAKPVFREAWMQRAKKPVFDQLAVEHDRLSRQGYRDICRALRVRSDQPVYYLIRALLQATIARGAQPLASVDPRVSPDLRHDLACIRAGLPWSSIALQVALGLCPQPEIQPLGEEYVARGFTRHTGTVYSHDPKRRAVARQTLEPFAEGLANLDLWDPLDLAKARVRVRSPLVSVMLELLIADRRAPSTQVREGLARLQRIEPPAAAAAEAALSGPPAPLALRAVGLSAPAGRLFEVQTREPPALRARTGFLSRRLRGIARVAYPGEERTWEVGYRLHQPAHSLARWVRVLGARKRLLDELIQPGLRAPLSSVLQERLALTLAEVGSWEAALMAAERSVASARWRPERVCHRLVGALRRRARTLSKVDRVRVLKMVRGIAQRGMKLDPESRLAFVGLVADLDLDLGGLLEDEGVIQRGREGAELARPNRIPDVLEDPVRSWWRLVRARSAVGAKSDALSALEKVENTRSRVHFETKRDPLLLRLKRIPEVRAFLDRR